MRTRGKAEGEAGMTNNEAIKWLGNLKNDLVWRYAQSIDEICELLEEHEPRVLTVNEVKRIGVDNFGALSSEDLTILWIEEFGKNYGIAPIVAKWDEDDWQGEPNNIVNVYYFGTDEFDQFSLTDYNKIWRCWTDKPTETQRMGAAWDA